MIKTFKDKRTEQLFCFGVAKGVANNLASRAARKLEYLNLAIKLEDLKTPPGNRLHRLHGGRHGQYAICVNDQWGICFRFRSGDTYDVEFCDYHS
jgi:proteic killer suppression protein